MLRQVIFVCLVLCGAHAWSDKCPEVLQKAGLTERFNESVAHTVHSMTVQGLRMFNPRATSNNRVPTVNPDLSSPNLVLPYAPEERQGHDFATEAMNVIDVILQQLGTPGDGLGPNWSPLERVVHHFHMQDVWSKVKADAWNAVTKDAPSDEVCACLEDVDVNGISTAVRWVAEHYKSGTPITLLNRPIPKLQDAQSWQVWRSRLLHYYTPEALQDSAVYLHCVTRHM